jgi:hypothetical protein
MLRFHRYRCKKIDTILFTVLHKFNNFIYWKYKISPSVRTAASSIEWALSLKNQDLFLLLSHSRPNTILFFIIFSYNFANIRTCA